MTGKLSAYRPQRQNANRHKPYGLQLIAGSIQRDGYSAPMVAAADGEIFSGSARLEVVGDILAGAEPIVVHSDGTRPVIHVRDDIPTAEDPRARRLGVADNVIARVDYDPDGAILAALADEDDVIKRMIADDDASMAAALAAVSGDGVGDAEPQFSKANELQNVWQTERGQLWRLGEHYLLCGDSTVRADVERVMGGEKAEMVWTDPPYGVAVGDKNKFLNSIAPGNRVEENLENDTLDEPGLMAMLCAAFDNAIAVCTAGAGWYVTAPPGPLHILFGQVLKDRGIWRQTIQWVKNNSTFSPMGVCYHWQAEPIFFGWLPNGGHRWYGGRKQTTVWMIDRPTVSPEHPTMKPVELVTRAIENSSLKDEIILDPFCGSGTMLIACQNLNRRCRAIEIAPGYVAVTLQRMKDAFGIVGVLAGIIVAFVYGLSLLCPA